MKIRHQRLVMFVCSPRAKKKKEVITVGVGRRFCVVHHLQLSILVAWRVAPRLLQPD